MSENKVAPIRGRYETLTALVSHVMGDPSAEKGLVIYFGEGENGMNIAEIGLTPSDWGLILLEVMMRAQRTWEQV